MYRYKNLACFEKLLKYYGNVYNMSRILGISPTSIYRWKRIPTDRAVQIENDTEGSITIESLIGKDRSREYKRLKRRLK